MVLGHHETWLQNRGGGGELQLIMPENITNEMVLRNNGKCFGRLEEEEEEEEAVRVTALS